MKFKVGDLVKYFSVNGDKRYRLLVIEGIYPDGIPSFKKPMLKLDGISGLVDAAHCEHYEVLPVTSSNEVRGG